MDTKFFYVYDRDVMKYLRYTKNIPFICTGRHIKTNDQFWQFYKTDETYQAVQEYMQKQTQVSV